jgi:hypothetical protein
MSTKDTATAPEVETSFAHRMFCGELAGDLVFPRSKVSRAGDGKPLDNRQKSTRAGYEGARRVLLR